MNVGALKYTDVPDRARRVFEGAPPDPVEVDRLAAALGSPTPDEYRLDNDTEILDGVTFTHRVVHAPGDLETVRFHAVEAGQGEVIVFLHGIPDSWFEWHHQMAELSKSYRCIAVDLKGYGQSEKSIGDYRHCAAAEQLVGALDLLDVAQFNIVSHDRGTVQADYIVARHSDRVLRYARGEQHLHHFHPDLAAHGPLFADSLRTGLMDDAAHFVAMVYTWLTEYPVAESTLRRVVQEFSYPGIASAVPRYFNSTSFRQEWIERRSMLMPEWKCPIAIIEGLHSKSQPREFYVDAARYIPTAKSVSVHFVDSGHFWPLEKSADVTDIVRELLATPSRGE